VRKLVQYAQNNCAQNNLYKKYKLIYNTYDGIAVEISDKCLLYSVCLNMYIIKLLPIKIENFVFLHKMALNEIILNLFPQISYPKSVGEN